MNQFIIISIFLSSLPHVLGDGLRSTRNLSKSDQSLHHETSQDSKDQERKLWFWSCPSGNQGDGCSAFCPCSGANRCDIDFVCKGPGVEGSGCSAFRPCGNGLRCDADFVCRGPGKEGSGCSVFRPCGNGLTCDADFVCKRYGKEGSPCSAFRPCGDGFKCDGDFVCKAPGKEGSPCWAGRPCGDGFTCDADFVCKPYGKEGSPCSAFRPCGDGFSCDADFVCKAPGKARDSCSLFRQCASGLYCPAFVHQCFPDVDVFGESCLSKGGFEYTLESIFTSLESSDIEDIVSSKDIDAVLDIFLKSVMLRESQACSLDTTVYSGVQIEAQSIAKGSTAVGIYASSDGKFGAYSTECYGGGAGLGGNVGVVGGVLLGTSDSFSGESEVFDRDVVFGGGYSGATGITSDNKVFAEVGASGGAGINFFSYNSCKTDIIKVYDAETIEEKLKDLNGNGESETKNEYTEVLSESCEYHGLTTITNVDECKKAATAVGRTTVWGPHGGYEDVIDGCSARFGKQSTNLFFNEVGICDPNHRVGEWTFTGCKCTEWMPCLCKND